MTKKPLFIIPFVLLSLLTGLWTGLQRMSIQLPFINATGEHGAIMIGSFLGTLIILERTVTLSNRAVLLIPFINAISLLFFATGNYKIAYILLVAGSFGLTVIQVFILLRFREYHNYLMFLGALSLLTGNILLIINLNYSFSVMWWMAFFLLTIVGERLELSKYLPVSEFKKKMLVVILVLFVVGLLFGNSNPGIIIPAAMMIASAIWLLMYDIALKTVKKDGLFRFTALLLIAGYIWLLLTGLTLLSGMKSAFAYDALLHSFFLGFVFSMIFAHSPIILPGIFKKVMKPYHPSLYIWFVLLQVSLLARIAGDHSGNLLVRQIGGIVNEISILAFFVNIAVVARLSLKKKK